MGHAVIGLPRTIEARRNDHDDQKPSVPIKSLSVAGDNYDRVGPGLISPRRLLKVLAGMDVVVDNFCNDAIYHQLFFKKRSRTVIKTDAGQRKRTTAGHHTHSVIFISPVIIPGFDYRYQWSAVPVWVVITANVLVSLGYVLIFLVFKENSYASTVIQVDKDQEVIKTGPYAMVRHPMYTGLLIMILFTPLALGSYWGLLFSCLFIPTVLFRIKKEEEVLLRDLSGYKDYYIKTRFSLIPLIW
ncbi:MAG: methyltransferase family protein [Syntrophomonadaceae bacterium]